MSAAFARRYRGATQSDALIQFTADTQAMEAAGYRPVAQTWRDEGSELVLDVAYKHVSLAPRSIDGQPVAADERIASLRRVVGELRRYGWWVEHQSDEQAVVVMGHGLSGATHLAHGVMTLATIGMWGIVWWVHYGLRKPRRRLVGIDASGIVLGARYEPGRAPSFGRTFSASGLIDLPPDAAVVTVYAWSVLNSTIICEVEGDQPPAVAVTSIDLHPKEYEWFEVYLTANPGPGARLAYFVLT